jgi:peptidoglycan/xylan/chitin deacetylase (PgdA/CDA1 family)
MPKLLVLVYHRILPEVTFNPLNTIVSVRTFIQQLDILACKYPMISLQDAMAQCRSGRETAGVQVVLTFDDGYWDSYEVAFPILQRKGLPAAFFLVTNYIGSNRPVWDWEIVMLLNAHREITDVEVEGVALRQKRNEPRATFAGRVLEQIKSANMETTIKTVEVLKRRLRHRSGSRSLEDGGCMTWEQVRKMRQGGMEVGSHGLSHRSLARIPLGEAVWEITKSKQEIEDNTKASCAHFAFPFGSKSDYSPVLVEHVKRTGFETCLLNIHGYNHLMEDAFCLKRIIMTESTDLAYLLG